MWRWAQLVLHTYLWPVSQVNTSIYQVYPTKLAVGMATHKFIAINKKFSNKFIFLEYASILAKWTYAIMVIMSI